MYELRLEVNIDIIKRDIEPEVVRKLVRTILEQKLGQYLELQTVKIIHPVKC